MTGADSFFPSRVVKLKRLLGFAVLATVGWFIGRTGSIVNVRPVDFGSDCTGFCVAVCSDSLEAACAGSLTGFDGFISATDGRFFTTGSTDLLVGTCTMSLAPF